MNVRAAAESDLEWLAERDGHLDAAQLGRKIRDGEMFVAESDAGEPIGLLRVDHLWSALPHIAQIRVLEPYRRRGVGRALVEFLERASREAGATKLLSSTRPDYLEAQRWHRAVGFRECGRLSGFGPSGEPVVFFLKDIR